MLVFGEGKTGVPGEKLLGTEWRVNNKLNPHMTPGLGIACSRLSVNGDYRMRPGDVRRAGSGSALLFFLPDPARPAPAFSIDSIDREPGTG